MKTSGVNKSEDPKRSIAISGKDLFFLSKGGENGSHLFLREGKREPDCFLSGPYGTQVFMKSGTHGT